MKDEGYKIRDQGRVYFRSFSTVHWFEVFTCYCYVETIINSLRFCKENKRLQLITWCVMSNHLHLICGAANETISDVLKDFKKIPIRNYYKTGHGPGKQAQEFGEKFIIFAHTRTGKIPTTRVSILAKSLAFFYAEAFELKLEN